MIRWQHKLTLKDLFTEEEDAATVRRVAGVAYQRLELFRVEYYPCTDQTEPNSAAADLRDLTEELETISNAPDAGVDWFNNIMDELYDWGDSGHRLWIE